MTSYHPRLNSFLNRLVAVTVAGTIAGYVPACTTRSEPVPQLGTHAAALTETDRAIASLLSVNVPLGADSHCTPSPRADIPTISAITGRFRSSPNLDDLDSSAENLSLSGWVGGQVVITCEYFRTDLVDGDPWEGWTGGGGGAPGEPPPPPGGGPGGPLDPPCAVAIPFQPYQGLAWDMLESYLAGDELVSCTPDQPDIPDCNAGECDTPDDGGGGGGSGYPGGPGGPGGGMAKMQQQLIDLQGALIDFDFTDEELVSMAAEYARGDAAFEVRLLATIRQVAATNREHQRDPAFVAAARARNAALAANPPVELLGRELEGNSSEALPDLTSRRIATLQTEAESAGLPPPEVAELPPGAACVVCGGAIVVAIGALLIAIGDTMYLPHVKDPDAKVAKWISVIGAWLVAAASLALLAECAACPPFVAALAYVAELVAELCALGLWLIICILINIFAGPPRMPC